MQIDSSYLMQLGQLQQQQTGARRNISSLQAKTRAQTRPGQSGSTAQINQAGQSSPENDRLKQACSDFQAIFVKQMLDSMRKTVNKTGLLDGGRAEEIFEDMLYDEYAQKISKTADLGLDDMLYQQLSRIR